MSKIITFLLISFLFTSCENKSGVTKTERVGQPLIISLPKGDSEMKVAIEKAQETLPHFNKALTSENPELSSFALKVRFKTLDSSYEHIWIIIFL